MEKIIKVKIRFTKVGANFYGEFLVLTKKEAKALKNKVFEGYLVEDGTSLHLLFPDLGYSLGTYFKTIIAERWPELIDYHILAPSPEHFRVLEKQPYKLCVYNIDGELLNG